MPATLTGSDRKKLNGFERLNRLFEEPLTGRRGEVWLRQYGGVFEKKAFQLVEKLAPETKKAKLLASLEQGRSAMFPIRVDQDAVLTIQRCKQAEVYLPYILLFDPTVRATDNDMRSSLIASFAHGCDPQLKELKKRFSSASIYEFSLLHAARVALPIQDAASLEKTVGGDGFSFHLFQDHRIGVPKPTRDTVVVKSLKQAAAQVGISPAPQHPSGAPEKVTKIGIIDTGFDLNVIQPLLNELGGRVEVAEFKDFEGMNFHGSKVAPYDADRSVPMGHGTTVLSRLIAPQFANRQYSTPRMKIYMARAMETDGDLSSILAATNWLQDVGVDVINMSLGVIYSIHDDRGTTFKAIVDAADGLKIRLIAASGNYGEGNVTVPGVYSNVISVGAVHSKNTSEVHRETGFDKTSNPDYLAPGTHESTSGKKFTCTSYATPIATRRIVEHVQATTGHHLLEQLTALHASLKAAFPTQVPLGGRLVHLIV